MRLTGSKSSLHEATRQVLRDWDQTKEVWRDRKAKKFDKTYFADMNERLNGSMFRANEFCVDNRWETFQEDAYVVGAELKCPECEQEYGDTINGFIQDGSIHAEDIDEYMAEASRRREGKVSVNK
jgi:hypothetical protein